MYGLREDLSNSWSTWGEGHALTLCKTRKIWHLLDWRMAVISTGSRWVTFSRPRFPLQSNDWCTASPPRNPALPWLEFWEQVEGVGGGGGGGKGRTRVTHCSLPLRHILVSPVVTVKQLILARDELGHWQVWWVQGSLWCSQQRQQLLELIERGHGLVLVDLQHLVHTIKHMWGKFVDLKERWKARIRGWSTARSSTRSSYLQSFPLGQSL